MVGATLLPFEPAAAPRYASPLAGASNRDGFADAMSGALAAPRDTRGADDTLRSARRPESPTTRDADDRVGASSRRAAAAARPATTARTGRDDEAADEPSVDRRADGTSDGTAADASKEPRAEARTAGDEAEQAADAAAETSGTAAGDESVEERAVAFAVPVPAGAEGDSDEAGEGDDPLARGRRWAIPAENPGGAQDDAAASKGVGRQGAGGQGAGLKVGHAIQEARGEAGAASGQALGQIAQAVVAHAHADATADTNAAATTTPVTQAVETANAAAKTPSAAETASVIETAIASAETVAGVEASAEGAGTSESGTQEQAQPKPPSQSTQANGSSATAVAASEAGVRFTVNGAAGNAAYASATPRSEEAAVLPQIVKSIRLQAVQGTTEARVQLKPEHLGNLNITLKVEHNQVTATIQADVAAVRQWIESHEASLRQALSEQGLHLARLVVHPDDQQAAGEQRDGERPGRQPRRRSWRDEEQTFEVLV